VRTLHSRPVLTPDLIQAAIADPSLTSAVGASDLALQVERIKITPLQMSLEELSKLWSVFFQTPYALSAAYQASVVLIEATERPTPPNLPVRQPSVGVSAAVAPPPVIPPTTRPAITVSVSNVSGTGSQPRSADVALGFEEPISPEQRVILLLSRTGVAGGFTFAAPRRQAATNEMTFRVSGVPAGAYVVRAQVDGVESLPTVNASGVYDAPRITL
jgi:hypothetical protein